MVGEDGVFFLWATEGSSWIGMKTWCLAAVRSEAEGTEEGLESVREIELMMVGVYRVLVGADGGVMKDKSCNSVRDSERVVGVSREARGRTPTGEKVGVLVRLEGWMEGRSFS
jgi:hypothetical protein